MSRRRRRRRRWQKRLSLAGLTVLGIGVLLLLMPAEPPPSEPDDLCAIFEEKPAWFRSTRRAFERWGVPEAVQMAVIHQESGFRARIRPPRRILFGFLPGFRPSSAYGYAQALDSTWLQYQEQTGRPHARRHRFDDVAHFVGWYGDQIHRLTGIAKDDAYRLYLAYHEGPGGFARGRHLQKPWLLRVARKVEARALTYQRQYDACRGRFEYRWQWPVWVILLLGLIAVWGLSRRWRKPQPRRRRRS